MASDEAKQAKADAKADKARGKAMRPWYKKKRFAIPLAIVVLAILGSLAGGGDTDTQPVADDEPADTGGETAADTSAEADEQEQEQPEEATEARLEEPARDGKFEFTVSGIECGIDTVGENEFLEEEAQGQYCLLDVTVENIGNEAQYLFADNQYLYDDQDRRFSADSGATFAVNPEGQALFEEINPGNSVTGTIVFDVPDGATIVRAELHDSAFSGGIIVDLT